MVHKRCPDCGEEKPLDDFPRNRNTRDGRGVYCKPCHNARGRETVRNLYGNSRHYHLSYRYGIGAGAVDEMIASQGGLCALCGVRAATQVDHDHATRKVRAILCLNCNAALGAARHDVQILRRAQGYLKPEGRRGTVGEESTSYRRRCPRCGEEKDIEAFVRNRSKRSGRGAYCRACHKAVVTECQERLHGGQKNYLLRLRYGADPVEVAAIRDGQEGLCALCRSGLAEHVDHDHETGEVRGILCFNCNRLLGYVQDDPAWFAKAIAYLERFGHGDVRETAAPYIIRVA